MWLWPFHESYHLTPAPRLSLPKQQAALYLWTILSSQKYSSEGFCLNKGKVKQLNCQTDNMQFSALSSMYSQKSASYSGSLSGNHIPLATQLSWIIRLIPRNIKQLQIWGKFPLFPKCIKIVYYNLTHMQDQNGQRWSISLFCWTV